MLWTTNLSQGQCLSICVKLLTRRAVTVYHSLLLSKLARYGLTAGSIQWFKDYLDNWKMITQINGTLSEPKSIRCGVPQGSILGPLLFVLYINDLVSHVKHCKVHLYADDTVLYFSGNSTDNVQESIQDDLNRLLNGCVEISLV